MWSSMNPVTRAAMPWICSIPSSSEQAEGESLSAFLSFLFCAAALSEFGFERDLFVENPL